MFDSAKFLSPIVTAGLLAPACVLVFVLLDAQAAELSREREHAATSARLPHAARASLPANGGPTPSVKLPRA